MDATADREQYELAGHAMNAEKPSSTAELSSVHRSPTNRTSRRNCVTRRSWFLANPRTTNANPAARSYRGSWQDPTPVFGGGWSELH